MNIINIEFSYKTKKSDSDFGSASVLKYRLFGAYIQRYFSMFVEMPLLRVGRLLSGMQKTHFSGFGEQWVLLMMISKTDSHI